MKIILNENNRAKVEEAVEKANGRATARTITASDIYKAVEILIDKLGIPRKATVGTRAHFDLHGQRLPSAYKWRADSTQFTVECFASGWGLVSIGRDTLVEYVDNVTVDLSPSAKDALVKKHESLFIRV